MRKMSTGASPEPVTLAIAFGRRWRSAVRSIAIDDGPVEAMPVTSPSSTSSAANRLEQLAQAARAPEIEVKVVDEDEPEPALLRGDGNRQWRQEGTAGN